MKLKLQRRDFTDKSTIGSLYINGVFQCFTLEDCDRKLESGGKKIYGRTAVPRGTYEVVIDYSKRFRQDMPRLLSVPNFEGIRIHPGNTSADTEGCILVGSVLGADRILNSRAAYGALLNRLEAAYAKGEAITMEIA